MMLTHVDLFSGLGGFSLAAHWAGFETLAHCEIEPYPQQVLLRHWPTVPICEDVNDFADWFVSRFGDRSVDLLTGGFPCQDISAAGRGAGLEGSRSGLWFSMLSVIDRLRPRYVVAENVPALYSRGIDTVLAGLESAGYRAEALVVGAWAVGAPHKRDRVFIVGERVADARVCAGVVLHRSVGDAPCTGQGGATDLTERSGEQGVGQANPLCPQRGQGAEGREREPNGADTGRGEAPGRSPVRGEAYGGLADPECDGPQGGQHAICRQGEAALRRRPPDLHGATGDGDAFPGVGGAVDGSAGGLDRDFLRGFDWPAGRGEEQKAWEAPRLVTEPVPHRTERLKALGNMVVPQQAFVVLAAVAQRLKRAAL